MSDNKKIAPNYSIWCSKKNKDKKITVLGKTMQYELIIGSLENGVTTMTPEKFLQIFKRIH